MNDTHSETTPTTSHTAPADHSAAQPTPSPESAQRAQTCSGKAGWQQGGKRRWKLIGAVALIALVGFVMGRASSHHHAAHAYARHAAQMNYLGQLGPQSLGMILDGIAATPEQRSRAVELFQR